MHQIHEPSDNLFNATVGAIAGEDISHYPVGNDQKKIDVRKIKEDMDRELKNLSFATVEEAEYHLDQAKATYEEVKSATEYQDAKTGRLLTIMAFLTAAAGTVFGKVIELFPLHQVGTPSWSSFIIFGVYALFVLYFLMVATGALISFYAMQTRFVTTKERDVVSSELRSFLFFKYIAGTEPTVWASSFKAEPKELLTLYLKHYIFETYLIATKASDKVRYLQPAQDMLQNAIKVLIAWIVVLVIAASTTPMQFKNMGAKNSFANVEAKY